MTPEQLKASILQYAIQGKLVEQREEGTAEELYNCIKEKQPILKKSKSDLSFDAIDFDIPDNWKWVELNQIYEFVDYRGKTPNKIEEGVFLITASNIRQGYMDYTRKEYISEDEYETRKSRGITEKGDLLFTTEAPMGYAALCDLNQCSCGQRVITFKEYVKNTAITKLFMYFILSPTFQKELIDNCTGTTAKGIKAEKLKHLKLPLPPFEEQHRIVAKIEELLPFVDRYAKAYEKLEKFNAKFPEDMKKSILQYAIQGKLVEQRPEEGTAEELYQQIQEEKQRLIKEKKIKKEKPLAEITEDEIPFDIPESWKWVRLQDICSLIGDIDHKMPKSVPAMEGKLFLSAKDLLDDGTINYTNNVKYISQEDFDRLSRKAKPRLNDIVYSRIGAALGKARVVENDIEFLVSYSCCVIRPIQIDAKYLRYFLESPFIMAHSILARQSIGVPDLGMGEIRQYIVALPPLEEQHRIVAKIEELLPYCDQLIK